MTQQSKTQNKTNNFPGLEISGSQLISFLIVLLISCTTAFSLGQSSVKSTPAKETLASERLEECKKEGGDYVLIYNNAYDKVSESCKIDKDIFKK
jgi:hypothetical protein